MTGVLPIAADKPRFVATMFGRIARRYDLMNTLMTAGQDQRWRGVAAAAALQSRHATCCSVLDVGTGTGKLAQAFVDLAPAVRVVGVDFAEAMLRAAPPTLMRASADALRLPFRDASFDVVVSAFVVRNLADVAAGIREQVRVLRPGGRLVILETTPGPRGPLRPAYRLYFRRIVPLLGRLIAGDASAYTYLPESIVAFVEPSRLADILCSHGLTKISIRRLALGSVAVLLGLKPSASAMLPDA
jgi:demethylmenaquinone methyltransferase / 2-methoxy-6-polyprenyl-1,4-benzoquinol methylase